MTKIESLKQSSPNVWHAKYKGEKNVYDVKVYFHYKNYYKSSCNCGSYFLPCRHINAVRKKIVRKNFINNLLHPFETLKNFIEKEIDFSEVLGMKKL
jgi:hypothetical protein